MGFLKEIVGVIAVGVCVTLSITLIVTGILVLLFMDP